MDQNLAYRRMLADAGDVALPLAKRPGGPTIKGTLIACGVSCSAAIVGTVPMFGIPGAVIYEIIGHVFQGRESWTYLPAESALPIAFILSFLWPISIVPGYLFGSLMAKITGRHIRGVILFATAVAWCVLLVVWLCRIA
jgi:hypothetical protein